MKKRRVLVVNLTRAGDLIQARFFFAGLRKRFPNCEIVLVTLPAFVEAARVLQHVDTIVPFDLDSLLNPLRKSEDIGKSFSRALEFVADERMSDIDVLHNMSHTPQAAMLCAAIAARETYGLLQTRTGRRTCRGRWYHYLLSTIKDRRANPFNLVEIFARCSGVADVLQLPAELRENDDATVSVHTKLRNSGLKGEHDFVIFIPGASAVNRQWPVSAFATVARVLNRQGIQAIVVGGQGDAQLGDAIASQSSNAAVSWCGQTTFSELLALVRQARLVIGNDTGPLHLAAAVKTRCVGLYIGPADAKDTAPFGHGHHILQAYRAEGPCDYRAQCGACDCREQINPEMVINLALQMLGRCPAKNSISSKVISIATQWEAQNDFSLTSDSANSYKAHKEQREFMRYVLSREEEAATSMFSGGGPHVSEAAQAAMQILEEVQSNPTRLTAHLLSDLFPDSALDSPFSRSFRDFLKLRLDLSPLQPMHYLAALDETLEIIVKAARFSSIVTQHSGTCVAKVAVT